MRRFLASTLAPALAAFLLTAGASAALAETGPNGGPMAEVDPFHLELVATDGTLKIYVFDHSEKPVDVKGATASATVLVDRKPLPVPLTVAGNNLLQGSGAFKAAKDLVVIVNYAPPGGKAVQGRFPVK